VTHQASPWLGRQRSRSLASSEDDCPLAAQSGTSQRAGGQAPTAHSSGFSKKLVAWGLSLYRSIGRYPVRSYRRRTRTGRPFSRQGVLHILRNRAYLGQVYFRGSWHPSAPAPLLDPALFDAAQAVLAERSEDYDRRFTGRHPAYLLSGLITCGACGRRYIGAAATGKTHRYRYYI